MNLTFAVCQSGDFCGRLGNQVMDSLRFVLNNEVQVCAMALWMFERHNLEDSWLTARKMRYKHHAWQCAITLLKIPEYDLLVLHF